MGRDSVPVGVGVCLCVLSGNFGARRFALGEQVARIGSSYVPPALHLGRPGSDGRC